MTIETTGTTATEAITATSTIYIASQTKYAHRWRQLRKEGYNIISTWIDEAGHSETADLGELMQRCLREAAQADVTILFSEKYDTLKCALLEAGACLAAGKILLVIGRCNSISDTMLAHPKCINIYDTIDSGINFIKSLG